MNHGKLTIEAVRYGYKHSWWYIVLLKFGMFLDYGLLLFAVYAQFAFNVAFTLGKFLHFLFILGLYCIADILVSEEIHPAPTTTATLSICPNQQIEIVMPSQCLYSLCLVRKETVLEYSRYVLPLTSKTLRINGEFAKVSGIAIVSRSENETDWKNKGYSTEKAKFLLKLPANGACMIQRCQKQRHKKEKGGGKGRLWSQ